MTNFNPQFEKIGNILIHEGCIEETQLSEALEEQKIKKDKLGRILLGKGFITENNLALAYSMQLGFKIISGDDLLNSNEDVVSLISEDFAKENNVSNSFTWFAARATALGGPSGPRGNHRVTTG